ncbi:hypothetical protein SPBR_07897 [Sporothrix brasiliensis 5110]|uniref:Protein FAM32A n=1 Tax=Sporothrix brasiliensis 5110 TaxID=1398154 RepID=A0A0C2INF3_9PEZI|nr:uncharacterized protein SPBR_07897 [Sporothrix brasiliensis 5110]KIH88520.1 hypothetical protein SPBR_07897 [Sporothrix brasiliensis 5110]
MPSGEYASASGGALRLKGAKVEKHKSKKHKKKRSSRDKDKEGNRARHAEDELEQVGSGGEDRDRRKKKSETKNKEGKGGSDDEDYDDDYDDLKNDPYARMTTAERRFAEAQDKKIRDLMHASPEEARAARPELFKSHKERLADLNNYLSRLSEHNDMPKIGPG